MSVLNGVYALSLKYPASGITPGIEGHALPGFGHYNASVGFGGTKTSTQPVDELPVAKTGAYAHHYGFNDFFNRIHFSTLSIDLGNVIGAQSITIKVWNAYQVNRTLNDVTESNASGMTLTEPAVTPFAFKPLQELTYTLVVTTNGDPVINASYTWDFDVTDVTVPVVGSRITPWLWPANGELVERLEWKTNVIQNYDGSEQRIQVRGSPRRGFEQEVIVEGADRRRMENVLYGWGARVFAVPVWFDGEPLQNNIGIGDTSITVSTQYRDYTAGGIAVVMTDASTFEIFQIASVSASSISLSRPAQSAWTARVSRIYPVRTAYLQDVVNLARFTGASSYGTLQWLCADLNTYTEATETTYRSYPVLTLKPNWVSDPVQGFNRKLQVLDFGSGARVVEDESGLPTTSQTHRWFLDGRQQIDDFRKWLYARKGRLTYFWMPTWAQDVKITSDFGTSTTVFDIEHQGYVKQIAGAIGRRDVRIELYSGAVYYRRITSYSGINSTTERLTIDSALGVAVTASQIAMVSFMSLCRLDSDAVEILWVKHDFAEASALVRSATNDL